MIETSGRRLQNGETLPDLTLPAVSGSEVSLRDYVAGAWSVVLFYRGNWCPFCNAQLSAYQRKSADLEQLGVRVIAISADTAEEARKTVERHHIAFPVLYGANPAALAQCFGTHVASNAHGTFVNSTGFVVNEKGAIVVAVYSSGAIGRIVADDAIGFIKYAQSAAK